MMRDKETLGALATSIPDDDNAELENITYIVKLLIDLGISDGPRAFQSLRSVVVAALCKRIRESYLQCHLKTISWQYRNLTLFTLEFIGSSSTVPTIKIKAQSGVSRATFFSSVMLKGQRSSRTRSSD